MSQDESPNRFSKGDLSEQAPLWEFGDIGFDTARKQWFLTLTDERNQIISSQYARQVVVHGGNAIQYQWKDLDGRPFWHVRERFSSRDIESITEMRDGTLCLRFRGHSADAGAVPVDYSYLAYAYHLNNKADNDHRAPLGFVDFFDGDDQHIMRIEQRWIVLEDIARKTWGEYPNIRLRIERSDIGDIMVTASCVVIRGS